MKEERKIHGWEGNKKGIILLFFAFFYDTKEKKEKKRKTKNTKNERKKNPSDHEEQR